MLIPYNVDRPTRKIPWVTYTLIGINIFVFLLTVLVANVNLPADRLMAQKVQAQLFEKYLKPNTDLSLSVAFVYAKYPQLRPENGVSPIMRQQMEEVRNSGSTSADINEQQATEFLYHLTSNLAIKHLNPSKDYDRIWQIQHMNDYVVWEPHYSTLKWLAYHPDEPSPWLKLLGMFGSMFLHGGFMHIAGNMFFLWIFGRAVEDTLGHFIYSGAYLFCGVAAALMQHVMTWVFVPADLGVPMLGASGAIAGVLGLFAPRFYRTPVRTFYILPYALPILGFIVAVFAYLFGILLGDALTGIVFGLLIGGAGMYFLGRTWCWGTFKAPAAWWLLFYVAVFDVVPGIIGLMSGGGGGVAHWAHVGGFGFGILYALLIGATSEGKEEFGLEDAQKYYDSGDHIHATDSARMLAQSTQDNAMALEILAKSLAVQRKAEESQQAFSQAISLYLKKNDHKAVVRVYLVLITYYPQFTLPISQQMSVGSILGSEGDYTDAIAALGKVLLSAPDSPEAEIAMLRCARIHFKHFSNAEQAEALIDQFMRKYPNSEWRGQAQRLADQIKKKTAEQQ